MNPTVEAALIAGGVSLISLTGTIIVAVSGFRNTRRVSRDTIAAASEDTIRDRLWEKQAAAYVEAIEKLGRRSAALRRLFTAFDAGDTLPARGESEDWDELTARPFAYASPAVVAALRASVSASAHATKVAKEARKVDAEGLTGEDRISC